MKTYKEFIAEVSGGSVGVSLRPGRGFSVGANVSGGSKTKQYGAGIRYDQNKMSGQGDRTSQGVTKAIQNLGTSASTSSAPTTQKSLSVGGSLQMRSQPNPKPGGGNNPKPNPKDRVKQNRKPDRPPSRRSQSPEDTKVPFKDTVDYRKRRQQNRLSVLQRDNKLKTKYRYAVPSSVGGRWGNTQASGANQMSDWENKGKNRTGGTNFVRTKVVGDPLGSGGTGRTISQGRYNRLFGKGGKYEAPTDGSTKYIPSKLGRKFNPSGYQANKFTGGQYSP